MAKTEMAKHVPAPCARCGKDMKGPDGVVRPGLSIGLGKVNEKTLEEFFKKQIGKYEIGKSYGICTECLISVMLKK